ncbi:MAG TPA: sensor histidine kinase [Actinomycetes bacterium]|nr:sensor histidine kinase [Actinomycetes bacterium]
MKSTSSLTQTARPGWKRPVVQFVAMGVVAAVVLALITGWFTQRAARAEAIHSAQTKTELLARAVAEPALTSGLSDGDAAAVDQFDRLMLDRVSEPEILRIKLWDATGHIIYSDEPRLIGDQFPFGSEELKVINEGGSEAEVSDLSKSENRYDPPLGQVLEVYTRVTSPEGEPLLFELYYSYDDVAQRTDQLLGAFRPITVAGILLFLVLAVPLVWLLARRLDDAASDRERLLLVAAQASDAERRRIARDLHDGVVQDLAGTSFALSATAREVSDGSEVEQRRLREGLESLALNVRRSLRSLRSLLVEIYPPDLSSDGLPAALEDLLAPVVAQGVDVSVDVADTSELPDEVVALVWRTAQECVRNALRHGQPDHLTVALSTDQTSQPTVRLEVSDNGRGFDPTKPQGGDHFGLRGLRDLALEAGGTLTVTSAVGSGTRVVLEVPWR